jgi:hypothetical protein
VEMVGSVGVVVATWSRPDSGRGFPGKWVSLVTSADERGSNW